LQDGTHILNYETPKYNWMEQYLGGYTSNLWAALQCTASTQSSQKHKAPCAAKLIQIILHVHSGTWGKRNEFVHRETIMESRKKARKAIEKQVQKLYKKPPRLASRYAPITVVSMEARLRRSTYQLTDWVARIQHQIKVTFILLHVCAPRQLTIRQAFHRARARNIS
jgi:hypothetical protein